MAIALASSAETIQPTMTITIKPNKRGMAAKKSDMAPVSDAISDVPQSVTCDSMIAPVLTIYLKRSRLRILHIDRGNV